MNTKTTAAHFISNSKNVRLKILIIHTEYQQAGGESAVVQEDIKLLHEAGHSVELLQFDNNGNSLLKLMQLPFNVSAWFRTLKVIKETAPDVVHIHNLHFAGSTAVLYAAKRLKVPIVMTLHNFRLLCPSATLFFKGKLFLKSLNQNFCIEAIRCGAYQQSRLLTGWLAASMWLHQKLGTWHLVNQFILLSPHAARLFKQSKLMIDPDRLTIKPNFVSAPPVIETSRSNHFLFVGRLCEEKGIDVILNAFCTGDAVIKIAGDGPLKDKVISYSTQFPNIQYLGPLAKPAIYREMQECTALIFPSIWYEGMPLTIIEAFACGTPVVASNLGAMATMIRDGWNGLHFTPGDVAALKMQVQHWNALSLLERFAISENAMDTYQRHYTPGKNLDQLLSVYGQAIKQQYKVPAKEKVYSN